MVVLAKSVAIPTIIGPALGTEVVVGTPVVRRSLLVRIVVPITAIFVLRLGPRITAAGVVAILVITALLIGTGAAILAVATRAGAVLTACIGRGGGLAVVGFGAGLRLALGRRRGVGLPDFGRRSRWRRGVLPAQEEGGDGGGEAEHHQEGLRSEVHGSGMACCV